MSAITGNEQREKGDAALKMDQVTKRQPLPEKKMKKKFGELKPKRVAHLAPTDVKRYNSTSTMFVDNVRIILSLQLMTCKYNDSNNYCIFIYK